MHRLRVVREDAGRLMGGDQVRMQRRRNARNSEESGAVSALIFEGGIFLICVWGA